MMNSAFLPPILQGNEQQQLTSLRDYLVKLAHSLDNISEAQATVENTVNNSVQSAILTVQAENNQSVAKVRAQASNLKALILKTADDVAVNTTNISTNVADIANLNSDLTSLIVKFNNLINMTSDYGTVIQETETGYEFSSEGFEQTYNRMTELTSALESELQTYKEYMSGRIITGYITDADGNTSIGIAISQTLSLTGESQTIDGTEYYELEPTQTVGIYTSTGWEFWINGAKAGYFTSADSYLHVQQIDIADKTYFSGGGFEVASGTAGFWIKKV